MMKKVNYYDGEQISYDKVKEYDIDILTKEELKNKQDEASKKHNAFLEVEEWRKHIEWMTIKTEWYAVKNDDDKTLNESSFTVTKVETKANDIRCIVRNQANLDALFQYNPLLDSFRFNDFTKKNEFNGARYDEDKQPAEIFNFFKRNFNEWCPRVDIKETIQETLNRNTYHPIKDFLKENPWDGVSRLETFLIDWYGAEDTILNRTYFKRWMIALIKRIMIPGSKFDSMLILAGEQGKKKTTLFNWLGTINGTTYYAEAPDNLKDINNVVYSSIGKYIMTFDDFDDICNKGDLGKVKSFVTTQERTAALKWQHDKSYEVTYVLAATTNQYDILVDDASFDERRFWIVKVDPKTDQFDIPEEIKPQLFAEAYYLYMSDPEQKLWIWEPELKEAEKELQKGYKKACSDPIADRLVKIFSAKYLLKDGMFDSEEHFLECMDQLKLNRNVDDICIEGTIGFFDEDDREYMHIKRIPAAWLIRYIDFGKRSTDRIIQILHTQGFKVEKGVRQVCYDAQLTTIDLFWD